MPRRSAPKRRQIPPDAKYGNRLISMFMNKLMVQGRKSLAERIMYDALDKIEEREKRDPIEVFEQAVQNATPVVETKPRRVGGATYQVPVDIRAERRMALALLDHPVHNSRTLMHLAELIRAAGVVEDPFGYGGLTGIDVGDDADVPYPLY